MDFLKRSYDAVHYPQVLVRFAPFPPFPSRERWKNEVIILPKLVGNGLGYDAIR
jgi:hypothetical protein